MGDGRAEGSSAIGDGGQSAISLMPDADGMHVRIFESFQLEGSYIGDLLYLFIWLHRVSVAARGIFDAACRIFFSCGMRDLLVAAYGI